MLNRIIKMRFGIIFIVIFTKVLQKRNKLIINKIRMKHLKKNYILSLAIIILLSSCYSSSDNDEKYWLQENYKLTGLEFLPGKEKYNYKTEFSLNNDGYSFQIKQLDDSVMKYFNNPPKDFFTNFPLNKTNRKIIHWTKTPLKESHKEAYNLARPTFDDDIASSLDSLLFTQGSYYSSINLMMNYDNKEHIRSVYFNIIDLKNKQIISIINNR